MDKREFLELMFKFQEILMHRDHFRNMIDNCPEGCGNDQGLCPKCIVLFEQLTDEDERLASNNELDVLLKKLKEASDADLTGEYKRILEEPRGSGVVH